MLKVRFILSVIFICFVFIAYEVASEPSKAHSQIIKYKIPTQEGTYFKTRDDFTRTLESQPYDDKKHQSAMDVLEKQLISLIGPVNIKGFPKKGKINLNTLEHELGFGQLDGLRFATVKETLVVTTEPLLKHFLMEHLQLPKDYAELIKSEEFYRRAFQPQTSVFRYAEIPVNNSENKYLVYAFIGMNANDWGPVKPTEIYVFVKKRDRILMVFAPLEFKIPGIRKCELLWDKNGDDVDYDKQFESYRHCYAAETEKQPFFNLIKQQAQSIVDRLLRDN
jgi:hypothetical protein